MSRSIEDLLKIRPVDRAKIDAEKARLLALIEEHREHTESKEKD